MIEPRSALEPALASMAQRWQDSGILIALTWEAMPARAVNAARCIRAFLLSQARHRGCRDRIDRGSRGTETSLPRHAYQCGRGVRRIGDGGVPSTVAAGCLAIRPHEAHCTAHRAECGVVVLNVGYRLAPEHAFPAAAEDAMTAFGAGPGPTPTARGRWPPGWRWPATVPAAISLRWQHCARALARLPLAAQLLIYAATNMDAGRLDADIARREASRPTARRHRRARLARPTGAGGQPPRSGASHHRRGSAHDFLLRRQPRVRRTPLRAAGVCRCGCASTLRSITASPASRASPKAGPSSGSATAVRRLCVSRWLEPRHESRTAARRAHPALAGRCAVPRAHQ